jgi:hypothetical protein
MRPNIYNPSYLQAVTTVPDGTYLPGLISIHPIAEKVFLGN